MPPEELPRLSELEQWVLLALLRLDPDGYGVTVADQIEARTGTSVALASVYAALGRLEEAACVRSRLSEPTPERGGRARKLFRVTARGSRALRAARRRSARMWEGLEPVPGETG